MVYHCRDALRLPPDEASNAPDAERERSRGCPKQTIFQNRFAPKTENKEFGKRKIDSRLMFETLVRYIRKPIETPEAKKAETFPDAPAVARQKDRDQRKTVFLFRKSGKRK